MYSSVTRDASTCVRIDSISTSVSKDMEQSKLFVQLYDSVDNFVTQ